MKSYAIGDVHGCYLEFLGLLHKIKFDPKKDKLYLLGDIIGRGKGSIDVLREIKKLGSSVTLILGNNDISFLQYYYAGNHNDVHNQWYSITKEINDDELMKTFNNAKIGIFDWENKVILVHAGVDFSIPLSNFEEKINAINQQIDENGVYSVIKNKTFSTLIDLVTSVRFINRSSCEPIKNLNIDPLLLSNDEIIPWYELQGNWSSSDATIVFGHWSKLGCIEYGSCMSLDSGCVYDGELTALNLTSKTIHTYRDN